MRTLLSFFFLVSLSSAVNRVMTVSGDMLSPHNWGGVVPGNGDTASIADGVTATLAGPLTIGRSPTDCSAPAILLNNTGTLIIKAGGVLKSRGCIQYASKDGANRTPAMTVQAGGVLEFDASASPAPGATHYRFQSDTSDGYRGFVTTGTATAHATVRSNAGGGAGAFRANGVRGGVYTLTFTDFLRIGDASTDAFYLYWDFASGKNLSRWDSTSNTWTSCGRIHTDGSMQGPDIFRHSYNTHITSAGAEIFYVFGDSATVQPVSTGKRELAGNVFDISMSISGFDIRSFTILQNYFGGRVAWSNYNHYRWAAFQHNLYVPSQPGGTAMTAGGDMEENYIFWDAPDVDNPHVVNAPGSGSMSLLNSVFEFSGGNSVDSGESLLDNVPLAPNTTLSLIGNLYLPNARGYQSLEMMSVMQCCSNTGTKRIIEHNTYFGDRGGPSNQDAVHTAEGAANLPGQIASYRSNLLWCTATCGYKLAAQASTNQAASVTICAGGACDYNGTFNLRSDKGAGAFSGAMNGYIEHFSARPGIHDVAGSPDFIDMKRNLPTFDSAYLGNSAPAWASSSTYTIGNIVSSADPTVYNGATINYRYVNQGACAGGNPQPGRYTGTSRVCWEWASLYRIRLALQERKVYHDESIGAYGYTPRSKWAVLEDNAIVALTRWVQAGFQPTNPVFLGTAHDGGDIGAETVQTAAPSMGSSPRATVGSVPVTGTMWGGAQ